MPAPAPESPARHASLLIGAGHAHVEVLRQAAVRAAARPPTSCCWSTASPRSTPGMLPGFVAGHYRATELAIDAVALARRAGAEVVLERACRIDAASQRVVTESGREIAYDFASLDVGSGVAGSGLPGVDVHALPVRPIERLIEGVDALLGSRARAFGAARPFACSWSAPARAASSWPSASRRGCGARRAARSRSRCSIAARRCFRAPRHRSCAG